LKEEKGDYKGGEKKTIKERLRGRKKKETDPGSAPSKKKDAVVKEGGAKRGGGWGKNWGLHISRVAVCGTVVIKSSIPGRTPQKRDERLGGRIRQKSGK